MKKGFVHIILFATLVLIALSCKKETETHDALKPDFQVSAASGLTTTIFTFDVASVMELGDHSNPVFLRFDWDGDAQWDIMPSTLPEYTHRYYQTGIYQVVMEASRLSGQKDTISRMIRVEQGYSPPQPVLIILPDSANILTEFSFDGGLSHDDEDSLEFLQFRWDFNGDQVWDTEFQSEPSIKYYFNLPGHFTSVMEVKDTMGLVGRIEVPIIVNLLNGNIKPRVSYSCDHCTVEDEFIFDASESFEEGNPDSKLLYSWNIFDDDSWEVVQSEESQFAHGIPKEGLIPVKLRVHSADGLYLDTLFHVEVHEFNTAPYANLSIGCRVGNTHTQFYFHSRYSWDRDESMLNLHIQWDLNNDGEWDSEWDDQMDVYTQYSQTGQHFVRLGITDTGDKQSIVVDTIMVFEGNHETGLIKDNRPDLDQYYGTVKIGDQWWMQENLNSAFQVKNFRLEPKCYQNNPENCEKYGGLYQLWQVHYEEGLCPKGWKVPSTKDWEALMETLGEDPIAQLVWGGASEMHLQTAGYIDIRRGYLGMGTNTHFWTRDITPTGIPIAWFFAPKQQINQKVYVGSGYEFYVRCIKE